MSTTPLWIQRVLTPEATDTADLRWAIETAAAMWARGEHAQGVRWLHHAAQTALADGLSARATHLGDAARELERITGGPGSAPSTPESPEAPVASGTLSASMKKTTPYKIAPDDITRLVAPDARLLEQCAEDAPPDHADTDPDIATPERPRPPPTAADAESTLTAVRSGRRVERTVVMDAVPDLAINTPPSAGVGASNSSPPSGLSVRFAAPSPEPADRTEETQDYHFGAPSPEAGPPSSPRQISSQPITLESPHAPLEPLRAVRVAIEPGRGNQITLTLLSDGEAAPAGKQEALLLPLGATGPKE